MVDGLKSNLFILAVFIKSLHNIVDGGYSENFQGLDNHSCPSLTLMLAVNIAAADERLDQAFQALEKLSTV